MRAIKFRKWAKHTNGEMAMVDDVILGGATLNDLREDDGDVLLQFTGLKDKNGKEIYEGDVVVSSWWAFGKENRQKHHVKYDNERARFSIGENPEVIGNIYENPDLLS